MAELHSQEGLLGATGDAFKSSRLDKMLSRFAASYKLYWFKGIFEEVCAGNTHLTYRQIVARMVADAWYPVVYFRLNLGASDVLADCIDYIKGNFALPSDAPSSEIIDLVMTSTDAELARRVKNLSAYVPYRLIRPFYEEGLALEKQAAGKWLDRMANPAIYKLNRLDAQGAPYVFNDANDGLVVDPGWATYLRDNQLVISGWLDMELVRYLQARNPSVPAISLKIYPPVQRDLSAAKRYWSDALADHAFTDIFTGIEFSAESFANLGPMSIDHFIPWSFVLHDEPWNLAPMYRNTNSSKNDKLPDLATYLDAFCAQQFDALMTLRDSGKHRKIIEGYLGIDLEVFAYTRSDASQVHFAEAISKSITPLHQIALNQGFALWYPFAA